MHTQRPYRIGLTGNIATGKSTVGHILAALGAEVIDADRVAHAVMAPGGAAYAAVVAAFGDRILAEEGDRGGSAIDRRALGAIVFEDPGALQRLERLVHPPTIAAVERRIAESTAPVVVVEAIKLLESGMAETYEAVWVVTCPEAVQVQRLVDDRGLTREQALTRIQAQPPQALKLARADVVIDTNGPLAATRRQVVAAWKQIFREVSPV